MSNKITENTIEEFAIKLLERLGYEYIYAPNIAPDTDQAERTSFEDVLLNERLQNAIRRINPNIPHDSQVEALKEIQRINSPELLNNNEAFHRMLTESVKVSYQKDGNQRGDLVWLIDFKNPENNEFVVANQFTVIEDGNAKRPDVILFVNGLPLVIIELKNPADENATIKSAYKQLQTYKTIIPSLFTYNGFMIISDGLEAKAGSLSAGMTRFMSWKSADGKEEASHLVSQLETLINGMLNKETLLDLIRHFVVFEKSTSLYATHRQEKEDNKTGITTISTVKKLAAYHQFYAVNRAVESTLRATGYTLEKETPVSMVMEDPANYGLAGVKDQPIGDRKGGVVWHTQGSGKSLSMVFYTGKIVLALDNPTVLVITDRNDLDDQLFDTFASSTQLLRQEPVQVEDRDNLKELLKVASGGVIFSTIQKFQPQEGNVFETLSERKNIVVIVDEAHRIPLELPLYKKHFTSPYKQFDKYFLFIEKGLNLLKPKGYFGYIVPSKFIKVGAGKKLRELLASNKSVEQIVSFGANQVFHNKSTYTCLLILKNEEQKELNYLEVDSLKDWKIRNIKDEHFDSVSFDELEKNDWVLVPNTLKFAYNNISKQSETLENLIGSDNIYNGIQTSANNIYIHSKTKEDKKYFYFSKDNIDWKVERELTRPYYKTSSGEDNLNTYRPFSPNTFVIYPYLKTEKGIQFVEMDKLKANYPNLFAFLSHYKNKLDNSKRDIKPTPETENEWYRYGRHQSLDKCDVPAKIIVGVLAKGNKYAIDYFGTLISSGGTAGYCMITLPDNFPYSIYYIQALLNSKYLEWFSALIREVFRGGYIARGTKVLKKLPIRTIDFNTEKQVHDKIASLQKELISIQGGIDKNKANNRKLIPLQRQFDSQKNELNDKLKTLYNLGESDNLIPLISKIYATN